MDLPLSPSIPVYFPRLNIALIWLTDCEHFNQGQIHSMNDIDMGDMDIMCHCEECNDTEYMLTFVSNFNETVN